MEPIGGIQFPELPHTYVALGPCTAALHWQPIWQAAPTTCWLRWHVLEIVANFKLPIGLHLSRKATDKQNKECSLG